MRERVAVRQSKSEEGADTSHAEAIAFVDRHRDFFEHYARGKVSFKPSPPGLDTFAFDLNSNDIYINSIFYKKRGFSDEKTSFATCHEIEHFEEKKQMLAEDGGAQGFANYLDRIKNDKAYGLLDNCVADIRQNRSVVAKTNQSFRDLEQDLYRNDLFKETDFTKAPKHIQFAHTVLREARVPDEKCNVSPIVREKLESIYSMKGADGTSLLDAMTHPDTPMSTRLKLQDKFLWPIVEELREEDMEEKKQSGGKGESESKESSAGGDPDEMFAEEYKEADEKVMNAVPIEKQEEAAKEWQPAPNPLQQADQKQAEKIGVRKEELERYRSVAQSVESIINPETNERVVEELRLLFERIIAKRLKPALTPRYPMEEGEDLVDPAGLVADVKAGNLNPKVWETVEMQERSGKRNGKVEWTIIGDLSTSMRGVKQQEQLKKVVMTMEAFKALNERADEDRTRMDSPFEVHTAVYEFTSTPLKPMGKELTEKQRIDVATEFGRVRGATPDYLPLEAILAGMTPEKEQQIKDGEVKAIVEVGTDGESDDPARVQRALKALRAKGVIVIGIGITESGRSTLATYAPDAVLVPRAEDLPRVLSGILKEHLADI